MAGIEQEEDRMTISELLETDFLKCLLCKKILQTPRLLPCLHSFCERCIKKLIKAQNQSNKIIDANKDNGSEKEKGVHQSNLTNGHQNEAKIKEVKENQTEVTFSLICPVCMSDIQVPKNGINVFPANTFLQDLCEMYDYKHEKERACEYCKFDGKKVFATSLCLDCQDNMCEDCSSAHKRTKVTRDHKVIPYVQVQLGRYDTDIRDYQQKKCKAHDNTVYTMFCDRCEVLMCSECKIESHDDHKWTTLEKAVPKYQTQMQNLLKGIQKQIPSVHNYVKFLSNYDQSVVATQDKLVANIEKQTAMLHTMIDEQKALYIEEIHKAADTERCEIEVKSKNLKTAATSLQQNARYLSSLLRHGKSDEILCLHREITHRLTQLINMQLDGVKTKLKMSFSPGLASSKNIQTIFGRMGIEHAYIKESEDGLATSGALSISSILPNVRNTVELMASFDAEGKADSKDIWPTGLAITKADEIVIADRDNKVVKIYDALGKLKTEIKGQGENKLGSPFDVAVLNNGDIAVTDHEAENVKVFAMNGALQLAIKGHFKHPRGITVNNKGDIIVLDCQLKQLTIHNPHSGVKIKTIEAKDNHGSKVLVDPYYVTVTPQNNIVVTDTAAPNIKVFSAEGKYLANYGGYGTKSDQVLQPYGVCCDDYGYTFVADNKNYRIHLLLPDGKLTTFLITKTDSLWHPMGVAINQKGYLVLTEALGKVKIYKYI